MKKEQKEGVRHSWRVNRNDLKGPSAEESRGCVGPGGKDKPERTVRAQTLGEMDSSHGGRDLGRNTECPTVSGGAPFMPFLSDNCEWKSSEVLRETSGPPEALTVGALRHPSPACLWGGGVQGCMSEQHLDLWSKKRRVLLWAQCDGDSGEDKQLGSGCACRPMSVPVPGRQEPSVGLSIPSQPGKSLPSADSPMQQFSKDVLRHTGMW